MTAEVRPYRDGDAPRAAALLRELLPGYLVTEAGLRHWLTSVPARANAAWWVAERDGGLVGWADAEFRWQAAEPGIGELLLAVHPDARGRGIGSLLYDRGERHLLDHGAWKLESHAFDPAGLRFAARRGFVETRHERLSALDPVVADVSELPALVAAKRAEGFRVVPLADLLDRPQALHALYDEAERDMPTDDPSGGLAFEEWRRETLDNPLLDRDASMTVLHGEQPVSLAWLLVDREGRRAEHELTGTLRAYRGRGLARLAKLAAIRWCAEHGIRTLLTGNDTANAPMLAINDRLGYRPTLVVTEVARVVDRPTVRGRSRR